MRNDLCFYYLNRFHGFIAAFIFEDIYSVLKEMKFMKLTGITEKKNQL